MTSPALLAEFEELRGRFIWTRTCFNTFQALYNGDGDEKEVMEKSAIAFFSELNRVFQEYCLLQFCKLTDPAPDITVSRIVSLLRHEGLLTPEIEKSANGMLEYRALIVDARRKIIAHTDRKIAMSKTVLGVHSEEQLDQFFEDMFAFNDDVGRALGIGPLDFRATLCEGDVLDLLKCLRRATAE